MIQSRDRKIVAPRANQGRDAAIRGVNWECLRGTSDVNFSDLFVVFAVASALYGLVVALTRQKHFLAKAVNPHRAAWLVAACVLIWAGIGLVRWEARAWDVNSLLGQLRLLVTEEPTPARVKIGSMAIFLGITFLVLVGWCQLFLPRDPSTFRRPEDRRKAFRYYVHQLRGGLDYAMLGLGDGEVLEEVANPKQILSRAIHLPKVAVDESAPRVRTVDDQIQFWRQMALSLHQRMPELDTLIDAAHQGHNRRIVFDAEYGGFFFKYLRLPDPTSKVDTGQFVFGATLNQVELEGQTAEQHFRLLVEAITYIERGIRVG